MLFPRRELRHCADPLDTRLYMGGDSESSTSADTTLTTNTITTDRRGVADGGSVIVGDGSDARVSVVHTVTDADAIAKGAALAELAILENTKMATQSRTDAGKLAVAAVETTKGAFDGLKDAFTSANEQAQAVASGNKTLAIAGLVLVGLLGIMVFQKRRA